MSGAVLGVTSRKSTKRITYVLEESIIIIRHRGLDNKRTSVVGTKEASIELSLEQKALKEPLKDVELRDYKGKIQIYNGHPECQILQIWCR